MIIVKIIGGLGNQMFQYAFAKALQQNGYEVKIDITAFEKYKLHGGYQLDKYDIDLLQSSKEENSRFYSNCIVFKVLKKIGFYGPNFIKEKKLFFSETLLKISDNTYVEGYFQSEKYFKNIREILILQFLMKDEKSDYAKKIAQRILEFNSSVSLHIRRGDYTNVTVHGTCSLEYYMKAINFISSKYDSQYFIFSDDIFWAKENLKIENGTYIESKEERSPHEDVYLMSLCKHNIIANSTFSWWGAWLNTNKEKIVIAPKRWFADEVLEKQSQNIVCDGWIKI